MELIGYDSGSYKNYYEAKKHGATYKSGGLDGLDGFRGACEDIGSIIYMFTQLTGNKDYEFGTEYKGLFIKYDDILDAISEPCDDYNNYPEPGQAIQAIYQESINDAFIEANKKFLGDEAVKDKLNEIFLEIVDPDNNFLKADLDNGMIELAKLSALKAKNNPKLKAANPEAMEQIRTHLGEIKLSQETPQELSV